jgi:hypothetical protein
LNSGIGSSNGFGESLSNYCSLRRYMDLGFDPDSIPQ